MSNIRHTNITAKVQNHQHLILFGKMFKNLRQVLNSSNLRTFAYKHSLKKQVISKTPLISCKVSKFNQYVETVIPQDAKFGSIPLASSGWKHYRAKGDHFTIHPNASQEVDTVAEKSFADLQLNEQVIENLKLRLDITQPSSIQCRAFSHILRKDHTLIAAETGCGKTLAYLIPIVQQILSLKQQQQNGEMNTPLAVILTPGRELGEFSRIIFFKFNQSSNRVGSIFCVSITATQIGTVAEKLCSQLDVNVKTVLGGNTKRLMMHPKFEPVDILVGSMGAISKLATTGIYRMQCVRHVVIDEADTMFDDTFSEKLVYFMRRFPVNFQLS